MARNCRAFLLAISIPLLMLTGVVAYLLRPLPQDRVESGQIFEDPMTGKRWPRSNIFLGCDVSEPQTKSLFVSCLMKEGFLELGCWGLPGPVSLPPPAFQPLPPPAEAAAAIRVQSGTTSDLLPDQLLL
jgi:hypothetical protein